MTLRRGFEPRSTLSIFAYSRGTVMQTSSAVPENSSTESSWQEKRQARFQKWLAPPVQFVSTEAEQAYKTRVTRIIDTVCLQKPPDRIPCIPPAGSFPIFYGGSNLYKAAQDPEAAKSAWRKFICDFNDCDVLVGVMAGFAGKAMDILRSKTSKSPGRGLPEDAPMNQFVEGEYMKADEYDAFLKDPSDFFLRAYLPRAMGAFEGFQKLTPFRDAFGIATMFLGPAVLPEVQAGFQAIVDYGKEMAKSGNVAMEITKEGQSMGFPSWMTMGSHAPFDLIGDTLRGTRGIFQDMYRRPEKLREALDVVLSWSVDSIRMRGNSMPGSSPLAFIALHKGDDNHMSDEQFDTYYWPHLREVVLALIEEGFVPLLFAEGAYNRRLKAIKDLPKGSVIWWFDKTDMAEAKRILGDTQCIAGNVPASLVTTGTPQQVEECCRNLIEACGPGGGYMLTGGAHGHYTPAVGDNLRAMIDSVKKYGRY
jgi:uroporphyrinogen-III decarboxylase